MGYSIHTPCKSKRARDKMFAFLREHYRPFSVLAAGSGCLEEIGELEDLNDRKWKHTDSLRGPLREDMSYGGDVSKWYIGFDFGGGSGGEYTWMKDFCRWVATKVGRLRQFEAIEGRVPYIVYDIPDDDWDRFDYVWPVLERSEFSVTADMRQFVVDDGFRGWTQRIGESRKHAKHAAKGRAEREGWTKRQLNAYIKRRMDFWDQQERIAKRADKYIKKELHRLSDLWEAR